MNQLQSSPFFLERVGLEGIVNLRHNLKIGLNLVGRKEGLNLNNIDIAVNSVNCSGKHCLITVDDNAVFLEDLNSANGTTINGVKIVKREKVELRELDTIGVVGGTHSEKEFVGNFSFFVYRLRKYDNDNLMTYEIDDDDEVILSDDDGEEVICLHSDDESVDSKEDHDLAIQLSHTFNEEIKKELKDFEEIEADSKIKTELYDFFELETPNEDNNVSSFDPYKASEDVQDRNIAGLIDTDSNDSTETVKFSPAAEQDTTNVDLMDDDDDDITELINTLQGFESDSHPSISHKDLEKPSIPDEEIKTSADHTPSASSDEDKLKQTVTKLNDQIKRKRGPEIIEPKPLEKRCKTRSDDNHINGRLKPETSPVTKEYIKDKLKSIAIAKPKDSTEDKQKVQTKVKAKVTKENRMSFLTDPTQIPGLPGATKAGKKVITSPPHYSVASKNTAVKSQVQNGKTSPQSNEIPSCSKVDTRNTSGKYFEVQNGKTSPQFNEIPSCSKTDTSNIHPQTFEAIPSCSKDDLRSPIHQTSMEIESPNIEHSRRFSNEYKKEFSKVTKPPEGSKGSAFQFDPRHEIISKLTSYDSEKYTTVDAFCRSFDTDVSPAVDTYQDYLEYRSTFVSLMMVELWKEIESQYPKSEILGFTTVQVNDRNLEKRGDGRRMVFHCQDESLYKSQIVCDGHLLYVKGEDKGNKIEFVALVTQLTYSSKSVNPKLAVFTMETSVLTNVANVKSITSFQIRPITVITNTLNALSSIYNLDNSPLRDLVINPLSSQLPSELSTKNFNYKGYDIPDKNQMSILKSIYKRCVKLNVPNISLLDGAAGTGKTQMIVNLALQFVYGDWLPKQLRILICSKNNKNIDDITAKLIHIRNKTVANHKIQLVRFGLLEHMDNAVRSVSVQSIKDADPRFLQFANIENLKKEKETIELKICALSYDEENDRESDLRLLKKRLMKVTTLISRLEVLDKKKLRDATTVLLNACDIICTTLGSISKLQNYVPNVDICIIDEATQCNEVLTLLPFRFGMPSLVLVGDSQLHPPTPISPVVNQRNYGRSLFARFKKIFSGKTDSPVFEIHYQHRMHPEILNWPNNHFYGDRLLPKSTVDRFPLVPYKIISYSPTIRECDNIMLIINMLLDSIDRNLYTIGVVCTNPIQNSIMSNRLKVAHEFITSNTADLYLQEKDVIIVWISKEYGIFHLVNQNILNMAFTRAKNCLLICGADLRSYKNRPFWKSLLENAQQRKCLQSFKAIGPKLIDTLRKKV